MNIAFVSAVFPYPLFSGGQVRLYHLLKRLSQLHTITLISFIRSEEENTLKKHLPFLHRIETIQRGRAWQASYILKAITSSYPFLYSTYYNTAAHDLIKKIIVEEHIDLIHAEPGYVYPSLPDTHIPVILAEHNIEHQIYQGYVDRFSLPFLKPLLQYDVQKIAAIEQRTWKQSSTVIVVSPDDAKTVKDMTGIEPGIVPNGVDPDYFDFKPLTAKEHDLRALFVGSFRWMQNKDAVKYLLKDIWPAILAEYPKARLDIVGKSFPQSMRPLVGKGVTVKNNVEDIRTAYHTADVLLAPIEIGGGTKYKILEAMASGLPVITTQKGIEGMPLEHGTHVLIANSISDYPVFIKRIRTDTTYRNTIIRNARKKIVSLYSWNTIAQELNSIWKHTYEKKD